MKIDPGTWKLLAQAVIQPDLLSPAFIDNHSWQIMIIDDNFVSDETVVALNRVLGNTGVEAYFSLPTSDLCAGIDAARIMRHSISDTKWSEFFRLSKIGYAAYLEDCIFFAQPLTFILLRTGEVRHTIYAGQVRFLESIFALSLKDTHAVACGTYWPDDRIETLYHPVYV
jgi:hypothetical protein